MCFNLFSYVWDFYRIDYDTSFILFFLFPHIPSYYWATFLFLSRLEVESFYFGKKDLISFDVCNFEYLMFYGEKKIKVIGDVKKKNQSNLCKCVEVK